MEVFGLGIVTIALFVGFGLFIGILFGFFGMGGSFLVTPALLVVGYPVPVAVGSGLAFVFGTSVIGALRHRDYGQIDYKLAALMIPGMTFGIEIGKRLVFFLEEVGLAEPLVSVAYIGLLGFVGAFTLWEVRNDTAESDRIGRAARVRAIRLPPKVTLGSGLDVSAWLILVAGGVIGVLSGFLGVGGGFLLLPAMIYGLGVPAAVAVGTGILQITVSGAYGAFVYADAGAVALSTVGSLLAGSAFGVRIGAAATTFVDEESLKSYFGAMLLAGSLSVAASELSGHLGIEALNVVSIGLIFGAPIVVSATIVIVTVCRLKQKDAYDTVSEIQVTSKR